MKLIYLFAFSVCVLVFNSAFCQEDANRKLLVGTWKFFGLEYLAKQPADQKNETIKDLEANKELVISFDMYGHFKVYRVTANKKDDRFVAGKLVLTKNGKHLSIEGLAGDVILLNNEYLKLLQPDRSVMVFQRKEFLPK